MNWLVKPSDPSELRRAARLFEPDVLVYYWDGSTPVAHELRDISLTGAYLYTTERWYPGTIVRLLVQAKQKPAGADDFKEPAAASISIPAKVVWHGKDGVALQFIFRHPEDRKVLEQLIDAPSNRDSAAESGDGTAENGQPGSQPL